MPDVNRPHAERERAARPTGLDATLLALADPTRRAILQRLTAGDARVTELARPFAISLNSVSKHLRQLERAGLVHRRRRGREHVLSLNAAALDEAADWIEIQRAAWRGRLAAIAAVLTETDASAPKEEPDR